MWATRRSGRFCFCRFGASAMTGAKTTAEAVRLSRIRRMPMIRSMLVAVLLLSLPAFADSRALVDVGAPSAPGSGEPFLFAMHDGFLLSWLEPVPNTKETALRFAAYRGGRWSEPRT